MAVKEGAKAPLFALPDSQGRTVSLTGLRRKGWVVLYFYPKDDTPGCTQEACDFRDLQRMFTRAGATIVGVSPDGVPSHQKFSMKHTLSFPLSGVEGLWRVQTEKHVWSNLHGYRADDVVDQSDRTGRQTISQGQGQGPCRIDLGGAGVNATRQAHGRCEDSSVRKDNTIGACMDRRQRWCSLLMVCGLMFSSGCVSIGHPFETSQVQQIQTGTTTQAQIKKWMGSPSSEGLKDGNPLWTYLSARVSLFGGKAKGTVLSIEFDEAGVVSSYSYVPY